MKLYLGRRLRHLRRELGLNQSAMAAEIGVSPSYLNHLERNQRPVTAQVLLKLAEVYDVDLKSFAAEGGEGVGAAQLGEIFADPMFAGLAVPRYELVEVADNAPGVADAVSRLYAALVELRRPDGWPYRRCPGRRAAPWRSPFSSRASNSGRYWSGWSRTRRRPARRRANCSI